MKKYIQLFLCFLIMITAGCGKKKQKLEKLPKLGSTKTVLESSAPTVFDENLQAFALDDDALHVFAHDATEQEESLPMFDGTQDRLPVENSNRTNHSNNDSKPIFQWQSAAVDQSKQDFKIIYFEFDKHTITQEQQANLAADIEYAKKMISLGKTIVVEGHACDSAGSAVYNMALSERRAKFIATQFVNAGISKQDLKIAARGQEMPRHKGGNRHEQAVNRRVELFAIDSK